MLNLQALNPEQRQAVKCLNGPLMILAGAGTGKTRVITYRIANLLSQGVQPKKIAAMTFTNKAANEMKTRIRQIVSDGSAEKVFIGTFHRFCLTILRKWSEFIERPKNFTLIAQSDQLYLVKQALEEVKMQGILNPDFILYDISKCKNSLITPSMLAEESCAQKIEIKDIEIFQPVYHNYERLLKVNKALDFDDCILKVYYLLREYPEVKEKLRSDYSHFLVDEFQDTNHSQFSLIKELVGSRGNVCVVGDDDQSIYSWRGAVYETFMNFEEYFENCVTIKLEQNYRCPNVVLGAANALIKNNTIRKDKSLWSKSPHHNDIVFKTLKTPTEEARWLAEKCLAFLGQNYKLSDIAILYRTNSQAKAIEMALRECSLFYKTFGGQSFFSKKETKDFIAYLELISNLDSHMAFWRVINTPTRGVGLKTKEFIFNEAEKISVSPFSLLQNNSVIFSSKLREELNLFVKTVEGLRQEIPSSCEGLEAFFTAVIGRFKLVSHVSRTVKDEEALEKKMETFKDLPSLFSAIARQSFGEEKPFRLDNFLELVTLDNTVYESKEEVSNYISLMTIHAAKGLEFPIVFLAGCEEGILPHKNSVNSQKSIEEERRLLYVAITRAKEHLLLSAAQERKKTSYHETSKMSRFVKELPLSFEEKKEEQIKEEERKQQVIDRLSFIRQSLES